MPRWLATFATFAAAAAVRCQSPWAELQAVLASDIRHDGGGIAVEVGSGDAEVVHSLLALGYEAYGLRLPPPEAGTPRRCGTAHLHGCGEPRASLAAADRIMEDDFTAAEWLPPLPTADLVVSLGAAEQVPTASIPPFLRGIAALRPHLVLFAAPTPGEVGVSAPPPSGEGCQARPPGATIVTERTLPAWAQLLHIHGGLEVDLALTVHLRNSLLERMSHWGDADADTVAAADDNATDEGVTRQFWRSLTLAKNLLAVRPDPLRDLTLASDDSSDSAAVSLEQLSDDALLATGTRAALAAALNASTVRWFSTDVRSQLEEQHTALLDRDARDYAELIGHTIRNARSRAASIDAEIGRRLGDTRRDSRALRALLGLTQQQEQVVTPPSPVQEPVPSTAPPIPTASVAAAAAAAAAAAVIPAAASPVQVAGPASLEAEIDAQVEALYARAAGHSPIPPERMPNSTELEASGLSRDAGLDEAQRSALAMHEVLLQAWEQRVIPDGGAGILASEARNGSLTRLTHATLWALTRPRWHCDTVALARRWLAVAPHLARAARAVSVPASHFATLRVGTGLASAVSLATGTPASLAGLPMGVEVALRRLAANPRGFVQSLVMATPYADVTVPQAQLWPAREALAYVWHKGLVELLLTGSHAHPGFARRLRTTLADMLSLRGQRVADTISRRGLPPSDASGPVPWLPLAWLETDAAFIAPYVAPAAEPWIKRAMGAALIRLENPLGVNESRLATADTHHQPSSSSSSSSFPLPLPSPLVELRRPSRDPKGSAIRLLVISSQWRVGHSVHRNFARALRALQAEPDIVVSLLVLDAIGQDPSSVDLSGFEGGAWMLPHTASGADVWVLAQWLCNASSASDTCTSHPRDQDPRRRFDAVFWPQIGMHPHDMFLASRRIARVQFTTNGHPSSTMLPNMDFFVSGWDVEIAGVLPPTLAAELPALRSREPSDAPDTLRQRSIPLASVARHLASLGRSGRSWPEERTAARMIADVAAAEEGFYPGEGAAEEAVLAERMGPTAESLATRSLSPATWRDTLHGLPLAKLEAALSDPSINVTEVVLHALTRAPFGHVSVGGAPMYVGDDTVLQRLFANQASQETSDPLEAFYGSQQVSATGLSRLRALEAAALRGLVGAAARRFSERLVLVDGMGAFFEDLSDTPALARLRPTPEQAIAGDGLAFVESTSTGSAEAVVLSNGPLVVNLAWTVIKSYAEHLATIGTALQRAAAAAASTSASMTVVLRLFSSIPASEPLKLAALSADVLAGLQTHGLTGVFVEVVPGLPYVDYRRELSAGSFALDSYPFAGCNSMHDLLHSGVPTLTLEGATWRSRIGAALLRRLGLDWLVAKSPAEFMDKAVRLLTDTTWRRHMRWMVAQSDLRALLDVDAARQWPRALKRMLV